MTEKFIEKAILVHGDKYDYSKVDYKNCNTNITIICKIHGDFLQIPSTHLQGHRCSKCAGKAKSNTDEFIKNALLVHGDKYDYSKVDYKNNNTKVIIICKTHGEFTQNSYNHLTGQGCNKCSYILRANKNKTTVDEFIKKSKIIHDDKYDYSKVDYKNSDTKINIICKIHGEFLQTPSSHLQRYGCAKCAGKAKSNTEEFIKNALLVHGNKYDYSKVNYKNRNTKVIIICKEHGEFIQNTYSHLQGFGCAKCSGTAKLNTTDFINNAILVHGDKYDYSKVDYKGNKKFVIIICKKHGEFTQIPCGHLNKQGCPKCANKNVTTEEFIEKSKIIHGNKYDYSKVDYISSHKEIIIICKIHGDFQQKPSNHINGHGCYKCGGNLQYNTEEFIKKSILIHGDKYDYSKVDYKKCDEKVIIICKIHGEFQQKPVHHYITGCGCPKCNTKCYSKKQILWLNFLSIYHNIHIQHVLNNGEFLIPTTKYKADGYCEETNTIYEFHGDFWHGNPEIYKQDEINKKTNCSFKELYEKTIIREEKIKELGYNLVIIWENDWKKINNAVRTIQRKFIKYHY
jgi:hypothetical protein